MSPDSHWGGASNTLAFWKEKQMDAIELVKQQIVDATSIKEVTRLQLKLAVLEQK